MLRFLAQGRHLKGQNQGYQVHGQHVGGRKADMDTTRTLGVQPQCPFSQKIASFPSKQVYTSVPGRKGVGRGERVRGIEISLTRLLHSREISSTGLTASKTGSVPSVLGDAEE